MNKDNYTNRKVDHVNVDKSKKYLWKYIQEKKHLGHEKSAKRKSWLTTFFTPKKFAWTSAIAVITIIAVIFGPNLQNLLKGDLAGQALIANASFTMTADSQDSAGINANSSFRC